MLLFKAFLALTATMGAAATPSFSAPGLAEKPSFRAPGLAKKKSKVVLTQSDFDNGTYRITNPGSYTLKEDIEFCPQASNDYWPPMTLWNKYPPSAYYLGFFAAITVEADDVMIDLGGRTIRQCQEFYLVQRFFNVIELNNRVFVPNEGVSSLNIQKTDRPAGGAEAGDLIIPSNVVIKNGIIGRSSHAGIHGNGVIGLKIFDVTIKDFEVAGIHCNGCKDVSIDDIDVGPSASNVPALATFSNARFLELFTHTLIPGGFRHESVYKEALLNLFDETITFADRPEYPMTLQSVFDRLKAAVSLFRRYKRDEDLTDLSVDDLALLEEAKQVFTNPSGLTDGSVQYGIFFNRFGLPETDDNFNGAGAESANISIRNTKIHGLHANPVEVVSLMTEEGTHMQGPARDLLRIYDITSDRMRTLLDSRYKGNVLSDVYFALWQLSNSFYRVRVFDSTCGNFGSNASFPYNLKTYPSDETPTCAELGGFTDTSITGREVTMLQKRYFGGLQMSQGVYDWATTPLRGLDSVLATPAYKDALISGGRHKLVCNHDTMFHPFHGVVGMKIVEAKNVRISDVELFDFVNTADKQVWVCKQSWQLQPSGEDVIAVTAGLDSTAGATTRGIEIVRSDGVYIEKVSVTDLRSEEGPVYGIDIQGDGNDRTDHDDDMGVSFDEVVIERLSGPDGGMPFKSTATTTVTSGINVGPPEETDASLNNPRVVLNYQMTNARFPRGPGEQIPSGFLEMNEQVLIDMKRTTTLNTDEKVKAFRRRVLSFYKEHYGMRFSDDVYDQPLLDPATKTLLPILVLDKDGNADGSVILLGRISGDTKYHATSLCVTNGDGSDGECSDASVSLVHDFVFVFFSGPNGYTFHGVFGGDHGKYSPPNTIIWSGIYSFERIEFEGVNEMANMQAEYYGECPAPFVNFYGNKVSSYINCAIESDQFGKGMATGAFIFEPTEDGTEWVFSGYPSMIFDDQVQNPRPSPVYTNIFDDVIGEVETNDWHFSYLADGTYGTRLSAIEAVPYGKAHHYTHEAALQYFKLRTSLKTDSSIKALRTKFLMRLRDTFGINIKPSNYDDIPLDGVIDLGGGNHILPYVVNEDANQRVMTKRGHDGNKVVTMPPASRLHEGGFRLVAGRAGISTNDGRYPFGSMFTEGIYILEDSTAEDLEIEFYCDGPIQLNVWATGVVYNHLYNEKLGEGKLIAAVPLPMVESSGTPLNVRGSLVFGNLK